MKFGNCRLCGKEADLCESHIIPEFFYEPVYEKDNSSHVFYRFSSSASRPKETHKGLRQELFCKCCEKRFSDLENYVKPLWFSEEIKIRQEGPVSYALGVDYRLFKLFQLSIIWRASVCSMPEFSQVAIGEKHESTIKEMLMNSEPGRSWDFGCVLVRASDK